MRYFRSPLIRALFALAALFCSQACSIERESPAGQTEIRQAEQENVEETITTGDLLRHIEILASDKFEGRAPGTRGETLTVDYLTRQFEKAGLSPGNPDGSYVQRVPLAAITGKPSASFAAGGQTLRLQYPAEYLAISRHSSEEVEVVDSEVVFVGYGVEAPEYQWDDYKGADLSGKTLIMLVNDPPVPDPADPSKLDEKVFAGRAMTYYGRWTYKYEIAARKGAAAAILIHETPGAGYRYDVLVRSLGRENFAIDKTGNREDRVPVEGWITRAGAERLFAATGHSLQQLKRAARSRSFRPVPIGARANLRIKNEIRKVQSQNVVAKLEGSDPLLKNEVVIYSAHWDHLGRNESLKGDQIYNGAVDNASGVAGLLEIAEAFGRMRNRPPRSILLLATTAEEKGLLGAAYYAENPLYPLSRTVANINIDCLNPWGRSRDLIVIGFDDSPLHRIASEVARAQNRKARPDPEPEKGFFYRSDQFEFARRGIPALYTDGGIDLVGKPAEYGPRKRGDYNRRHYHKVSDEIKPDWDLSGAVEDLRLLFRVGLIAAASRR